MIRTRRIGFETLEERFVPANWGNPWPDAEHLTLSFAPDGTLVGQQQSNLFASLDAHGPTKAWQQQVLRAFYTWAVEADINLGLVPDGGQAFGSSGKPQGDVRFGDIRLGGAAYGNSVLAFTSPFDVLASTWSGDVRLNGDLWGNTPSQSRYDLFTAMLQEAGHAFGIGNSADRSSAMYEEYIGQRTGISAGDVASLRALYGARSADAHEGAQGNETLAKATRVGLLAGTDGALSLSVQGDLTTRSDVDVYGFRAPSLLGGMEVRLQRAGLSLVTPRITVLDSAGRVVASAESTDPTGGDLVLELNRVTPLGQYYVKIEGAGNDVFRIGGYGLSVRSLPLVNGLTGFLGSTVSSLGTALTNNDLHTNDSFATSSSLLGGLFAPDSRFDVAYQGSISDSWDVDYYRVQAPAVASGDNVLTVMTWATGTSSLLPRVTVHNAARQVVPAQVLVNEGGNVTVQVVGVQPGASYYVKLSAAGSGAQGVGNYFLGVDFGSRAVRLNTFVEGQLDAVKPTAKADLVVKRTALFHFVLEAESSTQSTVELVIRNQAGQAMRTVIAMPGNPVSLTLTLDPGTYSFTFRSAGAASYRLKGSRISDPIGPQSQDPTEESTQQQTTGSEGSEGSGASDGSGGSEEMQTGSGEASADWYYDWYWYYWNTSEDTGGGVQTQDEGSSYAY